MNRYKLNTGLWETKIMEFESDEEAWNELRKLLPGKWAGLYKEISSGKIINYNKNKKKYESKYTLQKIEDNLKQFIIVLFGSTNDKIKE